MAIDSLKIKKYVPNSENFFDKRILITGHAGFTGSWISQWLDMLGAHVYGLGLEPSYTPSIRNLSTNHFISREFLIDVCDQSSVQKVFREVQPELVLHLAAQPLVINSYIDVYNTMRSNVEGTSVILEASRACETVRRIVCITTDKVYKNLEEGRNFNESDELGGQDPYSSSKSAAELVIQGYVQAINQSGRNLEVQVARGGNIIGGGDFSEHRLIPDLVRSIQNDSSLLIRSPRSTRPWQHVISLCHGYLMLLEGLKSDDSSAFGAWNFGPEEEEMWSVYDVVMEFCSKWRLTKIEIEKGEFKESQFLGIDASKARQAGWINPWSVQTSIERTAEWYRLVLDEGKNPSVVMHNQLAKYTNDLIQ